MVTVRDVLGWLDEAYPPSLAEEWDVVGLDCGSLDAPATRVAFAVDPTQAVIAEAAQQGADLLITHHPLLLRGIKRVTDHEPHGRAVMTLLAANIAHIAVHTNADAAVGGVNDALATALGLTDVRPLVPGSTQSLRKIVTFVPASHVESVAAALADAGAGHIGDYDQCSFTSLGSGRFRPLSGADPFVGQVGELTHVDEVRIESVLPKGATAGVVAALLAAHPYETPAFDVIDLVPTESKAGTGRLGTLAQPRRADALVREFAAKLPSAHNCLRFGGDPARMIETVAVLGGSGDSYLDAARRSQADLYITGDLRHHPVSDFLAHDNAPALLDVPHAVAEWLWLPVAEQLVQRASQGRVTTYISSINTDPWSYATLILR